MNLIHKPCKGNLVLNLGKAVLLLTPSFSFSAGSVNIGIVEHHQFGEGTIGFHCMKCSTPVDKDSDEILAQCSVCREHTSPDKMYITDELGAVCATCVELLSESGVKKATDNKRINEYRKFVSPSTIKAKTTLRQCFSRKINL